MNLQESIRKDLTMLEAPLEMDDRMFIDQNIYCFVYQGYDNGDAYFLTNAPRETIEKAFSWADRVYDGDISDEEVDELDPSDYMGNVHEYLDRHNFGLREITPEYYLG
jgi:hypothetical protein